MLMALKAEWNLTVHQMDVVTTCLNGEVEELFMEIPEKIEGSLPEIINKEGVDHNIKRTASGWLKPLRKGDKKGCNITDYAGYVRTTPIQTSVVQKN